MGEGVNMILLPDLVKLLLDTQRGGSAPHTMLSVLFEHVRSGSERERKEISVTKCATRELQHIVSDSNRPRRG